MTPRIIVHHSCCGEANNLPGSVPNGDNYLVHADGTIVKPALRCRRALRARETVHIVLLGYFNSNQRIGVVDARQFHSLMELLQQLLYPGEDFFRQFLFHHRYCPGFKFPWEELEWRLWNRLA